MGARRDHVRRRYLLPRIQRRDRRAYGEISRRASRLSEPEFVLDAAIPPEADREKHVKDDDLRRWLLAAGAYITDGASCGVARRLGHLTQELTG